MASAAAVSYWLLPLLLLLLLLRVCNSSQRQHACSFPSEYTNNTRTSFPDLKTRQLRTWHTKIIGQYSQWTRQLVVLFNTPPWSDSIGQFKVDLGHCVSDNHLYQLVNSTDASSVYQLPGTNCTVLTISLAGHESKLGPRFGLCLELWTYRDGRRMNAVSMSPLVQACHVSMAPQPLQQPQTPPSTPLLPPSLADHLRLRYHLVASDHCCLAYAGEGGGSGGGGGAEGGSGIATSVELIALYCCGLCLVVTLIVYVALLAVRAAGTSGKTRGHRRQRCCFPCQHYCEELSLWRHRDRFHLPHRVQCAQPEMAVPYLHLLMHCKSVGSQRCLSANAQSA